MWSRGSPAIPRVTFSLFTQRPCWFQPDLAEREQQLQSPDVPSQRCFPAEEPLSFPTASFPIHRFFFRSFTPFTLPGAAA